MGFALSGIGLLVLFILLEIYRAVSHLHAPHLFRLQIPEMFPINAAHAVNFVLKVLNLTNYYKFCTENIRSLLPGSKRLNGKSRREAGALGFADQANLRSFY